MVYSLDCCNWGERAWVAMLGTIDNLNGLLTTDPPQRPGGKIRLGKIDNLNGLLTMNKIVNIEVNVDELGTMDNLNGLLTNLL